MFLFLWIAGRKSHSEHTKRLYNEKDNALLFFNSWNLPVQEASKRATCFFNDCHTHVRLISSIISSISSIDKLMQELQILTNKFS